MCGFFFTTDKDSLRDTGFEDVLQRGWNSFVYSHDAYHGIQSVLPACTGDTRLIDNKDVMFFYTGEIYNYREFGFDCDTDLVLDTLLNNKDQLGKFNGMFAFVLYIKSTDTLIIGRDKTGQIPLFIYNKDKLIVSNTIKSIVKNVNTRVRPKAFDTWANHKHYISHQTIWEDINEFPPGQLWINGRYSNIANTEHNTIGVLDTLRSIRLQYESPLPVATVNSGGVDSSIISKVWNTQEVSINHVGKDYISNNQSRAIEINETQWCEYVDRFIEDTYTVPYTWSWIGYYIMGEYLRKYQINVLLTGEGADEIFGGYPGYAQGVPTPYSGFTEHNRPIENKLSDQKVFIPVAAMGANLALGCHTIEPRSPFLDSTFLNNENYRACVNKEELKSIYTHFYGKQPDPKQGFAGFPNEYYNHVVGTNLAEFENDNYWKEACLQTLRNLT